MSPFLALLAGLAIAFVATRAARRSARATELRMLAVHLARYPQAAAPRRPRDDDPALSYMAEARESLDAELRKVRDERAPSLYSPQQARAAKAAVAAAWGIRIRVKP